MQTSYSLVKNNPCKLQVSISSNPSALSRHLWQQGFKYSSEHAVPRQDLMLLNEQSIVQASGSRIINPGSQNRLRPCIFLFSWVVASFFFFLIFLPLVRDDWCSEEGELRRAIKLTVRTLERSKSCIVCTNHFQIIWNNISGLSLS